MKLQCIRICLGTDGTAMFWPLIEGEDDYGPQPMDPEDALHEITGRHVPIEIACQDPRDESTHNYEMLLDEPNMDAQSGLLGFVREKAESGRIDWQDDAPVFWGLVEQLEDRRTRTSVPLQKI